MQSEPKFARNHSGTNCSKGIPWGRMNPQHQNGRLTA